MLPMIYEVQPVARADESREVSCRVAMTVGRLRAMAALATEQIYLGGLQCKHIL